MNLRAGDRLGPYEILGGLGAGGMGEVYRARDPRIERIVAVKILPADASRDGDRLRRFEQEVRASGSLSHPNVVVVHDVGSHEGSPYLVMELLEGETLRQRLGAGALPIRKALDAALQVARGLAAAHARGIVHRDIKPENLFVTKDGVVKILDFGLARLERREREAGGGAATATEETGPGVVMGTVGYMSPEQVRGEPVDQRTDIFALGAVLYELLAGQRAFRGATSVETLHAILTDDPPELPPDRSIPHALDRVVRHCLEKRPEDRYQSARDLAFELEGLNGTTAGSGRAAAGTRRLEPERRLKRWFYAAVGSVLLLAALGGTFLAGRRSAPPSPIPSFRQITFRRGLVPSGRFAPDGRSVVYAASWEGAAEPEVFSVSTEAPESRPLGFHGRVVGVTRRDELAIWNEDPGHPGVGTLARVPLAGGIARPVADSVLCADWAPDGERLAAVRFVDGASQVEFPLGTVLARQTGENPFGCLRFSPRGDRLAVGVANDGYRVFDTASGRATVIGGITDWRHDECFAWSPTGDEIWFGALEAVNLHGRRRLLTRIAGNMSVYDVSPAGAVLFEHAFARERVFARAPGETAERDLSIFDSSWLSDLSADGRFVLIAERGVAHGGRHVVYLRRTDGSPPMRLADDAMGVTLSPDGRWALVRPALVVEASKWSGLRLVPTGPGAERSIATPAGVTFGIGRWMTNDQILIFGREADMKWRLYLVEVKSGVIRPITPKGVMGPPGPGSTIAVIGQEKILLYPWDGGQPRVWPGVPGVDPRLSVMHFSPDGRSALVSTPGEASGAALRIERLELATRRRQLLHEIRPPDMAGVRFDYLYVTPDGRGYAYSYQQVLHSLYLAEGVR